VYQKSYPLQAIMGELFGMGQSQANAWIHELLPILKQALESVLKGGRVRLANG
jgi:hypothetical protein